MTINDNDLKCIGCGANIQCKNKDMLGYVPKHILSENDIGDIYCQRCFKIRNYNSMSNELNIINSVPINFLYNLKNKKALIVGIIDIFDFSGSLFSKLSDLAENNTILIAGNKEDLLPKSLKRSKIINWMSRISHQNNLYPNDIILISAKKNHQIKNLINLINKYRQDRDVYIVGMTNAGKSTLINQLIYEYSGFKKVITTSNFPGTTIDNIRIPLKDGSYLIDTPGIINNNQIMNYLSSKEFRIVIPNKEIKPHTYQLYDGQTLFISALARLDFIKGDKLRNSIVTYFSNNLLIHRTKLSNADEFYRKHAGKLLQPPSLKEINSIFPSLKPSIFKINEKSDLVFSGLGWISLPSNSLVKVWVPKDTSVNLRKAMI